jgi:septal ring factor EnvC (AmiA/AmiB activator)
MKNKAAKMILNGVVLAAMAALGITVYQLGTSSVKENTEIPEVLEEEGQEFVSVTEDTEDSESKETGTGNVEASLEENEADSLAENLEENAEINTEIELSETTGEEAAEAGEEGTEMAEETETSALVLPVVDFTEDTLMEWPVNGNVVVDYCMDQTVYFSTLDQYKVSPAIAVQAAEGTPVSAAVNGTVSSIKTDAQTGTTVTMDLGNGYQAVYGQLENLMVSEGETVAKGSTIGYVSSPTKYYSVEGSNLYFAMKKNDEPIDPIIYLP